MEIRTIESIKTTESLSEAVEYYREIVERIKTLGMSKDIAREAILEKFREGEVRVFDTDSGLRARTYVREGKQSINIKEAKRLLPEDTFNKLVKVGDTFVVLSVVQIKSEESNE